MLERDKASELLDVARGTDEVSPDAVEEKGKKRGRKGKKAEPEAVEATISEVTTATAVAPEPTPTSPVEDGAVAEVPLAQIVVSPETASIRQAEDDETYKAFKDNISKYGLLVPLLVTPGPKPDQFTLIGGHRRYRVATELGIERVPVRVISTGEKKGPVGKVLSRSRPTDDMVHHVVGLMDNIAREDLAPLDIVRNLRYIVDSDQGDHFKREGKVLPLPVAKFLGRGYQWTRNWVAVLNGFNDKEILEINKAVDAGTLSWTQVHTLLRSAGGVDDVRGIVWPKKTKARKDEEPEEPESSVVRSVLDIGVRASFDEFVKEGVEVKFYGRRSGRVEAEISVRFQIQPGREGFSQEKGDQAYKDLWAKVEEKAAEWRTVGTGKDRDNADVRVGAKDSLHTALQRLKAKVAEAK